MPIYIDTLSKDKFTIQQVVSLSNSATVKEVEISAIGADADISLWDEAFQRFSPVGMPVAYQPEIVAGPINTHEYSEPVLNPLAP